MQELIHSIRIARPPSPRGFLLDPALASSHHGILGPDKAAGWCSSSCIPRCASAGPRTTWCTERRWFNSPAPRHPAPETTPAPACAQTDTHALANFLPGASQHHAGPCGHHGRASTHCSLHILHLLLCNRQTSPTTQSSPTLAQPCAGAARAVHHP